MAVFSLISWLTHKRTSAIISELLQKICLVKVICLVRMVCFKYSGEAVWSNSKTVRSISFGESHPSNSSLQYERKDSEWREWLKSKMFMKLFMIQKKELACYSHLHKSCIFAYWYTYIHIHKYVTKYQQIRMSIIYYAYITLLNFVKLRIPLIKKRKVSISCSDEQVRN